MTGWLGRSDQGGFTLVELLVVIMIIGLLLAMALPTFLSQQNKARDSKPQTQLSWAYKAAKADSVDRGGDYINAGYTAAQLASAIEADEPTVQVERVVDQSAVVANHVYLI